VPISFIPQHPTPGPPKPNRLEAIVSGTRQAPAPPPVAPPPEGTADHARTAESLNEQMGRLNRGSGTQPSDAKLKAWHKKYGRSWDPEQDGDEDE